jgi:SAM-dependent methyltransferase
MIKIWRYLYFLIASFGKARWDTGISPPELLHFINDHDPGRALDLGCGTGTNIITLAQNGWHATGVDFIPRSIQRARAKAKAAGIAATFHVDSVTRLENLKGYFDLILDIGCYQGLPFSDRNAYQNNLVRLLAPGGIFLMYGFLHASENSISLGLKQQDLNEFDGFLTLISRVDNPDNRGFASTWLQYRRE